MAKPPKFAKYVMTNRKELEKASTILLNELCSAAVINGLPIKMGDPGQLTLPCEFGNSTSINALVDLGEIINLMSYSFYKKPGLPTLQGTKMTLRMVDHTITNPRGIIDDFFVKVGKFVFLVDFMVLDMKEDEDLPIISGRPFLSTAIALVEIDDSKLTLGVRNDSKKDLDELVEIKKMMEEELKVCEKPYVSNVKR
ncbi:uncharacterized protein LOC111918052 [Lactuca sativa]|uniref:uncharacterized protein LOC111918052 n=1 Tax=Lactuca sativa TaxID=4236 RepID=UPI000CD9CE7B|nr:uncharacterized protein LOC111918052 [Lactuca sativa]